MAAALLLVDDNQETRKLQRLNDTAVLIADSLQPQRITVLCRRKPTPDELRVLENALHTLALLVRARLLQGYYESLQEGGKSPTDQGEAPDIRIELAWALRRSRREHHWHTVQVERMDEELREQMFIRINNLCVDRMIRTNRQLVSSGCLRKIPGMGFVYTER